MGENITCCVPEFYHIDWINPLPNYKILGWSKLKAFADDKINAVE